MIKAVTTKQYVACVPTEVLTPEVDGQERLPKKPEESITYE